MMATRRSHKSKWGSPYRPLYYPNSTAPSRSASFFYGPPQGPGGQFNPQSGLYNGPGPNSSYFSNFSPSNGPPPRPRNNSFTPYPNQGPTSSNFGPPPHHYYAQQQIPTVIIRKRPLINVWKVQLNCQRRCTIKKMKARANGVGNRLKRLQRRCFWTSVDQRKKREKEQWKRFKLKKGREELKMSRRKLTQLEPCPLWSCPHPRGYRTKATLRGLDAFSNCYDEDNARPRRCISRASTQLSAMSRRSRTPIRGLCSSPIYI